MNLAMESSYLSEETKEMLIQKAFRDAKAVAVEQNIVNDETKEEILAKAEAQASSLKEASKL